MRLSIGADGKRIQAIGRRLSLVGLEWVFSETSFWGAAQFSLQTFTESGIRGCAIPFRHVATYLGIALVNAGPFGVNT